MNVSPVAVRRALHHIYAASAILLIVTGMLVTFPDLRVSIFGGYGREVLDAHVWAGWVFLAAPPIALALAGRELMADLRERFSRSPGRLWRRIHILTAFTAGFLLGLTGLVLWWDPELPRSTLDVITNTHELLTWFVIAELAAHLVAARAKIIERTRSLLGRNSRLDPAEELFDFVDDD